MALPASLLQQVEQHGCLTGCYGQEWAAGVVLDPNQAPHPALFVSCKDCMTFKVGIMQSLLPPGTTVHALADDLTRHNRQRRGFDLTVSSYHARGPGFWLQVAYYASAGVFLLDGERSRALGSDLDLLILAFQHGVLSAPDPRMVDPRLYTTQTVYVNYAGTPAPVCSRQDLLSAPQCRLQPHKGFQKVTLAEFQPVASAAKAPANAAPVATKVKSSKPTAAAALKVGDICPVCKAEVRTRALLNGTYVGCLC
jgi:hypothetical protein